MNADPMICDKKKCSIYFAEDIIKLCYYDNSKTGIKGGLKNNKRQDISKMNRMHYHKQKE